MEMGKPIRSLLVDLFSVLVSISVIQFGFTLISFEKQTNLASIAYDSIVGVLLLLIALRMFVGLGVAARYLPVLYGSAMGSFLWVGYKIVKFILIDWTYLTEHPEDFYGRHVPVALTAFAVLTPIFTLVTSGVVLTARYLASRIYRN